MTKSSTWRNPELGSATLELAIIAPAMLLLLSLALVAARVVNSASAVEQAAASAARSASMARDSRSALAEAKHAAESSLAQANLDCSSIGVDVDASEFPRNVGQPATVRVDLSCVLGLSDLAIPGLPGKRLISASATSPIDRYRGT